MFRLNRGSAKTTTYQSIYNYKTEEIRAAQENDNSIAKILTWKKIGQRPHGVIVASSSPEIRHYWNYWNSLELHDGIIYRRTYSHDGQDSHLQLLVPHKHRKELVDSMHGSTFGGHLGIKKTAEKILQKHYWFNLRDDIKVWVQRCNTCASSKLLSKKPRAPLGDMRVGAPMDRISLDILGPFPRSYKGNQYIQVITCAFSKWVEIKALPDQTALTCAEHLVDSVITKYGCPLAIHTDQGRNYESRLFKELCHLMEIRKTRTSPRNPQGNGQTERFNKTLIQMIRAYIKEDQREWDLHLDCLAAAY